MTADLTPRETVARALADDWNPDRDPILTAMFRDYAQTVLTALADHPGLVGVLAAHRHSYDSDCGMDYGCSCGAIQDYDEADTDHTAHLADVIGAWLRGAS